jgi:hypothetical protein
MTLWKQTQHLIILKQIAIVMVALLGASVNVIVQYKTNVVSAMVMEHPVMGHYLFHLNTPLYKKP